MELFVLLLAECVRELLEGARMCVVLTKPVCSLFFYTRAMHSFIFAPLSFSLGGIPLHSFRRFFFLGSPAQQLWRRRNFL